MVAGLGQATDPARGTSWAVSFCVDDADATLAKVAANGGTVAAPAMDVMDAGRMAVATDSTGAYFTVWQPRRHTGLELTDVAGSFTWAELSTSDIDAARSFYPAVLGVGAAEFDLGGGDRPRSSIGH